MSRADADDTPFWKQEAVIASVDLLSAQDGDVLIVKVRGDVSAEQATLIRERIEPWFVAHQKDVRVMVVDDIAEISLTTGDVARQIRELLNR